MTDPPDTEHRTRYRAGPGAAEVREAEEVEDDDDMMAIRLPIASSGEVRNEGDDPLTASELRGMASQINNRGIGVFPEHGMSDAVDTGMYSQFEKLGYWTDAELDRDRAEDDSDLLMATAMMPDPETLPAATGPYRRALATLKEQAKRDIPLDASIGWREDEDYPGGNDLMEVSIVGIGADPRTNTADADPVGLVARAAVDAGADAEAFVESVREAVESARPLGPPEDPDRFDTFEECKEAMLDAGHSEEEAEQICGAWENATDEQSTHDMSDDTDASEEEATTEEQTADDGETDTRAPEDVTEDDLLTFTAMHLDGMDEEDLAEAIDAADAEYIGECDPEALADLMSVATGAEYGDAMDALDALMGESQEYDEDGEKEDEEDEEQSADTEETDTDSEQSDEPDETQAADTEDGEERDADSDEADDDLREEVRALRDELDAIRSGDVDLASPDDDESDESTERTTDDSGKDDLAGYMSP